MNIYEDELELQWQQAEFMTKGYYYNEFFKRTCYHSPHDRCNNYCEEHPIET